MGAYETMFQLCFDQLIVTHPNVSAVMTFCKYLTETAINNHRQEGVLDFEEVAPVEPAWWINGLFFVIIFVITCILNLTSIYIFFTASMRSPTNILLAVVTAFDLLTCIFQLPLNVHAYLQEHYKELPAPVWCYVYNYVHNFLPSAFHSAAFLLNMCLSVQRCVGVKELRRFRIAGTYKGVLAAVAICTIISFSIHTMYPITMGVVRVQAISKKMLLTGELRKVDSCSVTARYTDAYDQLFSSYLWLRVAVLQILPALVLSCCNIVLIRASYTTYAYRKRLIGAMGAVEGFNPSFVIDVDPSSGSTSRRQSRFPDCVDRRKSSGETMMTESSSHRNSTNGGLVHILNNIVHHKNSSIGIMTDHEGEDKNHGSSNGIVGTHLWAENSVMTDHDSGVASHSGGESEVLAERPSAVDHDAHSCLGNKRCGEEKEVDAGRTFDLRQTEDGVMNEREGCGKEQAGSAYTRDAVHAWEDPVIDENAAVSHNDQQGKDNSAEQIPVTWEPREEAGRAGAHRASSEETTTKRKDSGVYWADFLRETMVTNGNYPHHSCREDSLPQSRSSDRIHGEKNGFLHPQPIRQILSCPALKSGDNSTTSERHRSFKRSSDALNRQSARNSKAQLQRGGERQKESVYRDLEQQSRKISFPLNFSIKGRKSGSSQLSRKLSFYRMSAELRSSVMLILVTSCTLVAEVFVIILLIFKFVTSVVLPGGEFITYTELANLIMISNIVTIITFPLNFAFFCGLSQAFRSTVREKLVALTRICNRQSS